MIKLHYVTFPSFPFCFRSADNLIFGFIHSGQDLAHIMALFPNFFADDNVDSHASMDHGNCFIINGR